MLDYFPKKKKELVLCKYKHTELDIYCIKLYRRIGGNESNSYEEDIAKIIYLDSEIKLKNVLDDPSLPESIKTEILEKIHSIKSYFIPDKAKIPVKILLEKLLSCEIKKIPYNSL